MTKYLLIIGLVIGCAPNAQVSVPVTPSVQPGAVVVQPGAVVAQPGTVSVQPGAVHVDANMLSRLEGIELALLRLSQTADTTLRDVTAGRDSKQNLFTVNLSGSGWPLAACIGLGLAGVGYAWWERRGRKLLEASAEDVAGEIKRLPTTQRKTLLNNLNGRMRNEAGWKRVIARSGSLVKEDHPGTP